MKSLKALNLKKTNDKQKLYTYFSNFEMNGYILVLFMSVQSFFAKNIRQDLQSKINFYKGMKHHTHGNCEPVAAMSKHSVAV